MNFKTKITLVCTWQSCLLDKIKRHKTLLTSFGVLHVGTFQKLEIRSVEHGICPIAEFTSP